MTDQNTKHPNYDNELLPENNDIFKPDFRRDSRGRYFMQLPGYGKWMVGNEPGSKVISQGSEDESGGPAGSFDSIKTGTLNVNTILYVGDSIAINGATGCIILGDPSMGETRPWMSLCADGILGHSAGETTFGFFLEKTTSIWNTTTGEVLDKGDVFIGGLGSDEFILWNDSDGKLYIYGDVIIHGDLQSENFVTGVSGWRLGYWDDTAEFQDVWVRGTITMEAGSTGSADYISETLSKFWAIEADANNTQTNTSYDTTYVGTTIATQVETGSARALNALDASNMYVNWLQTSLMGVSGVSTGPAVVVDSLGIRAFNAAGDNTLLIDSAGGNAMLRGTIYASAGLIANWAIDVYKIWKEVTGSGNYTKVELSANDLAGAYPHMQVMTDDNSSYSSATGIQMTVGDPSLPVPRLDVYKDGIKRVMLSGGQPSGVGAHDAGLYFFNTSGVVTSKITASNTDGDVTFGSGFVRLFDKGIRISHDGGACALNLADETGSKYLRMYVDISGRDYAGTIDLPTSDILTIRDNTDPPGNKIISYNGRSVLGNNYGVIDFFSPIGLLTTSSPPSVASNGWMFYHTTYNEVWAYLGGAWAALATGTASGTVTSVSGGTNINISGTPTTTPTVNLDSSISLTTVAASYFRSSSYTAKYLHYTGSLWEVNSAFYASGNITADGNLYANSITSTSTSGAVQTYRNYNFGIGGQISSNSTTISCNKDFNVTSGSLICSGSLQSGTASLKIGSTWFYVVADPDAPGHYYLRS